MNRFVLIAALSSALAGCQTCETCETCETGEAPPATTRFTATWTDLCTLSVEVLDGDGPYLLGLAQTGADDNGWYEEACNASGFCHPLENTLTLPSVHPTCEGGGVDALDAGVNTLFTSDFEEGLTYALFDSEQRLLGCFGHNCRYYDPDAEWTLSGN